MAARTASIDTNVGIASLSPYTYCICVNVCRNGYKDYGRLHTTRKHTIFAQRFAWKNSQQYLRFLRI